MPNNMQHKHCVDYIPHNVLCSHHKTQHQFLNKIVNNNVARKINVLLIMCFLLHVKTAH